LTFIIQDNYYPIMRLGEGVEWAVHCAVLLAVVPDESALPASRLAEFHDLPAPYLAKALQALTRAGITESVPGRRGGFRLARRASEITLLDIVLAVDGDEPAFRCTEIRRRGPARQPARCYAAPCAIAAAMWRAEDAWREELRRTTLADVLAGLAVTLAPDAVAKSAAWMEEVLR
jgi:Rrf2 family protein